MLADGTVARSGGHVIKNVAGYDLAKLVHGSYGTLAVIAEVVLRLHPVPKRSATLAVDCPLVEAAEPAARVLGGPHEPVAIEWRSTSTGDGAGPPATGEGRLLVRLDGTPGALPGRVERLRSVLGPAAVDAGADEWDAHAARVRGGVAPQGADGLATGGRPGTGLAVLRIGALPSRLPALLASLPGVDSPRAAITAGLGTGVATVALPASEEAVAAAHEAVHAAGGTSVLRARPPGFAAPAWGPPPSALGVLKAVKRGLDPEGRLGPGRFAPWT